MIHMRYSQGVRFPYTFKHMSASPCGAVLDRPVRSLRRDLFVVGDPTGTTRQAGLVFDATVLAAYSFGSSAVQHEGATGRR